AVEMLMELQPVGQAGKRIMEGEMANLVLGEPALADAPRGDSRRNREAEHDEQARHQSGNGESDVGQGRGGGLVEREGINAHDLSVLRHRNEGMRVSPAASLLATSTASSRLDVVNAARTLS